MRVTVQIILLTRGPQNHEKLRFSHTKTMSFARGKTRFLMGHVGPLVLGGFRICCHHLIALEAPGLL